MSTFQGSKLSGTAIKRLMRRHRITIRGLAERFNITQKRVRDVRAHGVSGFLASEWCFMITGQWPDEMLKNKEAI